MKNKDYYQILGVSKTANQDEIKSAYKKLIIKHHPDRNKDNKIEAEKKLKEINEAYSIIGDEAKRSQYDRYGDDFFSGGNSGFGQGGFEGFGGGDFDFGGFGSVFEEFFGRASGGNGFNRQNQKTRGSDLRFNLHITLEEAFNGVSKTIQFKTLDTCDSCKSSGSADNSGFVNCGKCNGNGVIRMQQGFFIVEKTCDKCNGNGKMIKNPCKKCNGNGACETNVSHDIKIPEGVDDKANIKFSGLGEAGIRGGQKGDLYVVVNIKKHSFFNRKGKDLYCEIPVFVSTLILGGKINIPTIEGKKIDIDIKEGTQTHTILKSSKNGMKIMNSGGSRGDLYITLKADIPKNLNSQQKALIEQFSRITQPENHQESASFFDSIKNWFN